MEPDEDEASGLRSPRCRGSPWKDGKKKWLSASLLVASPGNGGLQRVKAAPIPIQTAWCACYESQAHTPEEAAHVRLQRLHARSTDLLRAEHAHPAVEFASRTGPEGTAYGLWAVLPDG